jgi:RimJ/RimL family protein N-acetyltransferase
MIKLIPLERKDINIIRELRNKYYKYLRQPYEVSRETQDKWYDNLKDHIYFCIEHEYKIVGAVGFTYPDWINRKVELSFISTNYIDNYTDEVLKESLKKIFNELNFNKVFIVIYEFDPKKDLLEKAGFHIEAILKEDYYFDGRYWESYIYSMLRSEYK